MKRLVGILPMLALLATPAFAQRLQPDRPQRAAAAPQQNPTERLIQEVYLNRFQIDVGVSSEQLAKVQPLLMQWLMQRRNVTTQRNNAIAALRQLLMASNAPEPELLSRITEIDRFDTQVRNRENRLVTAIDPELTPLQRARFRLFLVDIEQYLRDLVDTARNGRGTR